MRNYKERAGNFETNYQHLDVLTNKIDRFLAIEQELTELKLKEFQREYEKLIIGKENHQNIDYYISTEENQQKFKNEIHKYKFGENIMNITISIYPILLLGIIFIFSLIIRFLK